MLVEEHVLFVLGGMENLLEAGGRSSPHRFHRAGANRYQLWASYPSLLLNSFCKGRTLHSFVRDPKTSLDINKTRQIAQEIIKVKGAGGGGFQPPLGLLVLSWALSACVR